MNFPITTEEYARDLIRTGAAGYWELSLRDSISKTPIAHPEQTLIFLAGDWYIVPHSAFAIVPHGRAGNEACNWKLDEIQVCDPALIDLVQSEARRLNVYKPSKP